MKKCGEIWRIAVHSTSRRLATRMIMLRCVSADITSYLEPHQLRVGVQGESEIVAYYNHTLDGALVVKLDFKNASNDTAGPTPGHRW